MIDDQFALPPRSTHLKDLDVELGRRAKKYGIEYNNVSIAYEFSTTYVLCKSCKCAFRTALSNGNLIIAVVELNFKFHTSFNLKTK